MRNRIAALLALAMATVFLTSNPANAATTRVKILDFNYCGVNTACGLDGATRTKVFDAITNFQPDFVGFQEICENQFDHIVQTQSQDGNWRLYGMFIPLRYAGVDSASGTCDTNGGYLGNAILSHRPLTPDGTTLLDPAKIQKVGCARVEDAYETEVCVTHINPGGDPDQVDAATDFAVDHARPEQPGELGKPLVFVGDFNLHPDDPGLNNVYYGGYDSAGHKSQGRFQEADQCQNVRGGYDPQSCNRHTHRPALDQPYRTKLDYVFLKQAYFKYPFDVSIGTPPWSDHASIKATVTECSTPTC